MTLRFGTDGVRGVANVELTPEYTVALARAAARVFGGSAFEHRTGHTSNAAPVPSRPVVVVGRDTRVSGPMLSAALSAGFCAEGFDVVDLGVIPTPAVALASKTLNVVGAMVSASHNPFPDNGIKFFLPGGRKLDDATEAAIEAELELASDGARGAAPRTGAGLGTVSMTSNAEAFVDALTATLNGRRLDGLRVVLDCANGAASSVAPAAFAKLGAAVVVLHASPDGVNINAACGSTHPESLRAAVVANQADVGFAFDGDADRMLAVDSTGRLVDGDELMAMMAIDLRNRGYLAADTVVVTVMTNLGFRLAMEERGINVVTTAVGDRYVLEAIEANGYSLGGEQSGHLILRDHATTGDGVLSALTIADLLARTGTTLADQAAVMTRLPQVLRSVTGVNRAKLDQATELWDAVRAAEADMAGRGRVLIRPSGTEPIVRVMVEAPTTESAEAICASLCTTTQRVLGPA